MTRKNGKDVSTPAMARSQPGAADRALAEAAERRAAADQATQAAPEQGGRNGLDPVRYGDWEKNGIAHDF